MALKDTVKKMHALLNEISSDLTKSERGVKAASQRVRTGTIKFAKLAKQYRKESMNSERGGKKEKKSTAGKKARAPVKKVKKPVAKPKKTTRRKTKR
jgi:DNA-binding protein H-NS